MKKGKIGVLLICALLISTFASVLGSCGDSKTPGNDASTVTSAGVTTEAVTQSEKDARAAIPDDLEKKDFGGKEFRVLVRDNYFTLCRHISDVYMAEETGDVIDDAVYARNLSVEERFNVKIMAYPVSENPESTLTDTLNKVVLAGDDQYDLAIGHMILMGSASLNGLFVNWYDVPYINFDKPWWVASATNELSVDGKSFFALSDLTYNSLDYTYCFYFNKSLLDAYGIEYPYQKVSDGGWTIDYFNSILKNVYRDLNGNDEADEDDQFGFVTNIYSASVTWMWAFDDPITKRSSDGRPALALNNDKTPQVIEKLYKLMFETPETYVSHSDKTPKGVSWPQYYIDMFTSDRSVFTTGMFADSIVTFRDVEDYGMVPYPKWNEEQSAYYTMLDGHGPLMGIPMTEPDIEFVGMITEAMSAEGYKQVTPAYYDVALKTKFARDAQTAEMLDTILAGRVFDFGYLYDGWQGFGFIIQNMLAAKTTDFTSYYAKHEKSVLKYYDKVMAVFDEYGN